MALGHGVRLVALAAIFNVIAAISVGCAPAGHADDERRLALELRPPTTEAAVSQAQAIQIGNANVGFAILPSTEVVAFLSDPVRNDPAQGILNLPTSWIVRYALAGGQPHPVPLPGVTPALNIGPGYTYVMVNASSGEVLEITHTGL